MAVERSFPHDPKRSGGVLEYWCFQHSNTPLLHRSGSPIFHQGQDVWGYYRDELVPKHSFPTSSSIFVETLCRSSVENGLFRQSFPTKFLRFAVLGQALTRACP